MKAYKSVDEYIAQAPKDLQPRIKELRKAIKEAAPDAEERISYGVPFYHYQGRLVYWGLFRKHISLFAIFEPVRKKFKEELEGYVMSKGTIQFPLSEELPVGLVKKLVNEQVKLNEKK